MEEEKKTNIPISFRARIASIKLGEFIINDLSDKEKESIQVSKLVYEFQIGIKNDQSNKNIDVSLTVKFFSDQSKTLCVGQISSTGLFSLENYEELIEKHNAIPAGIAGNFAGILISSTRGFLLLKSEGTLIEGALMPMIDITQLVLHEVHKKKQ